MTEEELIREIKIDCFNSLLDLRNEGSLTAQDIERTVLYFIDYYDTTHEILCKLGRE